MSFPPDNVGFFARLIGDGGGWYKLECSRGGGPGTNGRELPGFSIETTAFVCNLRQRAYNCFQFVVKTEIPAEWAKRLIREANLQQRSVQQGAAGGLTQQGNVRGEVICRFCGSDRVFRLYREGFLQRHVYSLFGFYPWRCKTCAARMILHKRKKERRTMPPA